MLYVKYIFLQILRIFFKPQFFWTTKSEVNLFSNCKFSQIFIITVLIYDIKITY